MEQSVKSLFLQPFLTITLDNGPLFGVKYYPNCAILGIKTRASIFIVSRISVVFSDVVTLDGFTELAINGLDMQRGIIIYSQVSSFFTDNELITILVCHEFTLDMANDLCLSSHCNHGKQQCDHQCFSLHHCLLLFQIFTGYTGTPPEHGFSW